MKKAQRMMRRKKPRQPNLTSNDPGQSTGQSFPAGLKNQHLVVKNHQHLQSSTQGRTRTEKSPPEISSVKKKKWRGKEENWPQHWAGEATAVAVPSNNPNQPKAETNKTRAGDGVGAHALQHHPLPFPPFLSPHSSLACRSTPASSRAEQSPLHTKNFLFHPPRASLVPPPRSSPSPARAPIQSGPAGRLGHRGWARSRGARVWSVGWSSRRRRGRRPALLPSSLARSS